MTTHKKSTKRHKGEGGLYEGTANGKSCWISTWVDADGVTRRAYGASPEIALARKMERMQLPAHTPGRKKRGRERGVTTRHVMELWLADREKSGGLQAESVRKYRANMKKYILPYMGGVAIKSLTAVKITEGFARQTIPPSAYYHVWKTLKSMLEWAKKSGYVQHNVMQSMSAPRKTNIRARRIEEHINEHSERALCIAQWVMSDKKMEGSRTFIVLLFCGLRRAEALGVTTECVDVEHSTLRISHRLMQRVGGGYELVTATKNGHSRSIHLPEDFIKILRDGENKSGVRMEVHDSVTGDVVSSGTPLLTREDGTCWSYNQWNMEWRSLQEQYKRYLGDTSPLTQEEYIVPHEMRHITASLLSEGRESLVTVQSILGHLTPEMTEHYAHATRSAQEEAMQNIEDAIKKREGMVQMERVLWGGQEQLPYDVLSPHEVEW